jgi:hypothetical protein
MVIYFLSQPPLPENSMISLISDLIEESGSQNCNFDVIVENVLKAWRKRKLSDGSYYHDPDIELNIRTILHTNPRFLEDPDEPDHYQLAKKKRKVLYLIILHYFQSSPLKRKNRQRLKQC